MRIRRLLYTLAPVVLSVLFACACGDKKQEPVSISESVSESVSSVSEEKEAEVSVTETEEPGKGSAELTPEEMIESVTAADLDKAHTEFPAWDGFSDGNDSIFFVAAESEDGSAKLYCYYFENDDVSQAILRAGDEIIPIHEEIDYGWGINIYPGDFDGDGAIEYAIARNYGHGTGFYQEALIMVDSGEKEPVSLFSNSDDIMYVDDCIYDKIKYEYEEESGKLTYWIEENGARECMGAMEMDKEFWSYWEEGATFGGLVFGDIFTITFEDGVLGFDASGGMVAEGFNYPAYDYSVNLLGDFVYRNGVISYDNLRLESRINNTED